MRNRKLIEDDKEHPVDSYWWLNLRSPCNVLSKYNRNVLWLTDKHWHQWHLLINNHNWEITTLLSIPSQIEMIILILSNSIQFFFVFQKLYKTFCLDFMESGRGCSNGTIVRNYPANKITVGHDSMVFSPLCSGSDIFPLMTLTASEGNGADYIEWISQETPITIQTYLYHLATHPSTQPTQIPRYTPTIAHHQNK